MNQGRIWCVVNPTVGLPLFLGSVAVMSFTVHFAVLSSTTWMAKYWEGSGASSASLEDTTTPVAKASVPGEPELAINVAPASGTDGSASFVVTITPKAEGKDLALAAPE